MSRAHAVAPVAGANVPYRGPAQCARTVARRVASRPQRQVETCYLERAMLLWPRLDRARLRKVADNPARIAELVVRRTSQPYEVILAMLTRQTDRLVSPTQDASGFDSGRPEGIRPALRIVRSEDGTQIEIQDLLPA